MSDSKLDALERWAKLKQQGFISEEEFIAQKNKLFNSDVPPPVIEKDTDSNLKKYNKAIHLYIEKGYKVASRDDKNLTVTFYKAGEKINHTLHFLITVISCGFWVLIWAFLSFTASNSKSVYVAVYKDGKVDIKDSSSSENQITAVILIAIAIMAILLYISN